MATDHGGWVHRLLVYFLRKYCTGGSLTLHEAIAKIDFLLLVVMFTCGNNSRKRQRLPLENAVISLTGLATDDKEHYHELIERLGGTFTRDLTGNNTHLIALEATGAKYEAALLQKSMQIVQPSWLDACETTASRADESLHFLDAVPSSMLPPSSSGFGKSKDKHNITDQALLLDKQATPAVSLDEQIREQLDRNRRDDSVLFSNCHFYMLGFDENDDLLGKLIRRGMGIIHWELNPQVTHVIVKLDADSGIRDTVRSLARGFKRGQVPISVSAAWIVDSWAADRLQDASVYPPIYKSATAPIAATVEKKTTAHSTIKTNLIFKGSVFCLIRVVAPSHAVDFDSSELDQMIRANGGQLLSHKLLDALKMDVRNNQNNKRKLYAICWGAYNASHMDLHPLMSQVKRHELCHVIAVTPIWLQTCLSETKIISPRHLTPVLTASEHPWHNLGSIHISVSGYSGWKRTALMHYIQVVAVYDDAMVRGQTTHLIVKDAKGDKYDKAKEWRLHVVSVEWLYHVTRYGIGGFTSDEKVAAKGFGGCEDQFALPRRAAETRNAKPRASD